MRKNMKEYNGIDYQYKATFNEFPPDFYTDRTKRILIDAYYDTQVSIDNEIAKMKGHIVPRWEN